MRTVFVPYFLLPQDVANGKTQRSRRLHGGQGYQGCEPNAPRYDVSAGDEVMAAEGVVRVVSRGEANLTRASGGSLPHLHRLTQWAQSVVGTG